MTIASKQPITSILDQLRQLAHDPMSDIGYHIQMAMQHLDDAVEIEADEKLAG